MTDSKTSDPALEAEAMPASQTEQQGNEAQAAISEGDALDQRLKKLLEFMYAQPLNREIYYRVLGFCETRRALPEVEDFILQRPECAGALQSPYFIILDLVDHGAIAMLELAEDGHVIEASEKEGLSENEIDDLVVSFACESTELGRAAARATTPAARFSKLMETIDADADACWALMGLLTQKRSASEIDALMGIHVTSDGVPAGILLEKLEKSGVIAWDKQGWQLTEEGRRLFDENSTARDS